MYAQLKQIGRLRSVLSTPHTSGSFGQIIGSDQPGSGNMSTIVRRDVLLSLLSHVFPSSSLHLSAPPVHTPVLTVSTDHQPLPGPLCVLWLLILEARGNTSVVLSLNIKSYLCMCRLV